MKTTLTAIQLQDSEFLEKFILAQKKADQEIKKIRATENIKKQEKLKKITIEKELSCLEIFKEFEQIIEKTILAKYKYPYHTDYNHGILIKLKDWKIDLSARLFDISNQIQLNLYQNYNIMFKFINKDCQIQALTENHSMFIPVDESSQLNILAIQGILAYRMKNLSIVYKHILKYISEISTPFTSLEHIDIAGYDDLISQCNNILRCNNPLIANRHILFVGPPGCGKSMLAKKLVLDNNDKFLPLKIDLTVSGEILNVISEIAGLCNIKIIIVFDELDEIGRIRGASNEQSFTFSLLRTLDGIENFQNVKLICTSNRIESLDPALLRVGRLGPVISIDPPDQDQKLKIFNHYCKKYKVTFKPPESLWNSSKITGCDIRAAFETSIINNEEINSLHFENNLNNTFNRKEKIGF